MDPVIYFDTEEREEPQPPKSQPKPVRPIEVVVLNRKPENQIE
jgi:hypothetical protein